MDKYLLLGVSIASPTKPKSHHGFPAARGNYNLIKKMF